MDLVVMVDFIVCYKIGLVLIGCLYLGSVDWILVFGGVV